MIEVLLLLICNQPYGSLDAVQRYLSLRAAPLQSFFDEFRLCKPDMPLPFPLQPSVLMPSALNSHGADLHEQCLMLDLSETWSTFTSVEVAGEVVEFFQLVSDTLCCMIIEGRFEMSLPCCIPHR